MGNSPPKDERANVVPLETDDKDNPEWQLLYHARHGNVDEVENLICNKEVNVNCKADGLQSPLHRAALGNHVDVISLLILWGANVNSLNAERETPLHWAAHEGNCEAMSKLIEKGALVNAKTQKRQQTPLEYAAKEGRYEACEKLLDAGARVDFDYKNPKFEKAIVDLLTRRKDENNGTKKDEEIEQKKENIFLMCFRFLWRIFGGDANHIGNNKLKSQ